MQLGLFGNKFVYSVIYDHFVFLDANVEVSGADTAILQYSGSISRPTLFRPYFSEAIEVVPVPQKGYKTVLP